MPLSEIRTRTTESLRLKYAVWHLRRARIKLSVAGPGIASRDILDELNLLTDQVAVLEEKAHGILLMLVDREKSNV